jgi:hypothetical protein
MATTKAIKVKANMDHDAGPTDEEEKPGFYILLTGAAKKVTPVTKSFKTGVHGEGKGRLLRGAKWALRAYASSLSSGVQLSTPEAAQHLHGLGYQKLTVMECTTGKRAKKTGVQGDLATMSGVLCPCGAVDCPDIDYHSEAPSAKVNIRGEDK